MSERLDVLSTSFMKSTDDFTKLQDLYLTYKKKCELLQNNINTVLVENNRIKKDMSSLNEDHVKNNMNYNSKIELLENEIKKLYNATISKDVMEYIHNDIMNDYDNKQSSNIDKIESEKNNLKEFIIKLKGDYELLNNKLISTQNYSEKKIVSLTSDYNEQINILNNKIQQFQLLIDDTTLNEQLRNAQIEIGTYDVKYKSIKNENIQIRNEYEELKINYSQLELNTSRIVAESKAQLNIAEQNCLSQIKRCADVNAELQEQKVRNTDLEGRISMLEAERVQWINAAESSAQQARLSSKQSADQLVTSMAEFDAERKVNIATISKMQQTINDQVLTIGSLENKNASLTETNLAQDKMYREQIEKTSQNYVKELDELRSKLNQAQSLSNDMQSQLHDDIDTLKKDVELARSDIKKLNDDKQALTNSNLQLETIKMQLNHQLQAFQRESNDIHIELTELETKYRTAAQNEQQKTAENDKLKLRLEYIQRESEQAQKEANDQQIALISQMKSQTDSYRRELASSKQHQDALQAQFQHTEAELIEAIKVLSHEKNKYKKLSVKLSQQIQTTEAEFSSQKKQMIANMKQKQAELGNLNKQISEVERQRDEMRIRLTMEGSVTNTTSYGQFDGPLNAALGLSSSSLH